MEMRLSPARFPPAGQAEGPAIAALGRSSEAYHLTVQVVLLSVLAVVVLALAAIITKRSEYARAKIDRHGLDDLRRIYRHDNPRGPGLGPLIQDHRRMRVDPRPIDRTGDDQRGSPQGR